MADTTTTAYGLTKPEIGASEDTWGTKINTDLDTLDTVVNAIGGKTAAATLSYADSAKIATTATGVDVTGTAVTDGLTVSGNLSVDGGTIKLDGNYPVGTGNVALGDTALGSVEASGNYNVAIGSAALDAITTGDSNVGIGLNALGTATTSSENIAIGTNAMIVNTTGGSNVGIGTYVLNSNTTASYNTAVGYQAAYSNTTGTENVALGVFSLYANTTGIRNTALGKSAMELNTTGSDNVSVGVTALDANTTGGNNTAIGNFALTSNTTASYNTAVGYKAGENTNTGTQNVFVGMGAGQLNTTGSYNTYVGRGNGRAAGLSMTTGSKNTIIGGYNGNQDGLDIRTSSNNIVLSDGDGNPWVSVNSMGELSSNGTNLNSVTYRGKNTNGSYGSVGIMSDITRTSTNGSYFHFAAYDRAGLAYKFAVHDDGDVVNSNNSYGGISDVKLKENIVDASSQWDDIKALTVRKYSMKADNLDAPNMLGVIAQELETSGMSGLVIDTFDRDDDGNVLDTTTKQVKYSILYMKAVKALQEAMDRIETLEAKVTALENA